MAKGGQQDALRGECRRQFALLVEGVGSKRFAASLGLSPRQVNRMLSGSQPNPIERLILCVQSADAAAGDCVVDYICQELGGHFVRHEAINQASVNAVRECAEAIAAISDGQVHEMDIKEIRDAISALLGLINALRSASEQCE